VTDLPIDKSTVVEYRLETIIEQEGEREIFLYEGNGQMVQMGEWLYLRYEEAETKHKVTLKVSKAGKVTIIRRSEEGIATRMAFEAGEKGNALLPTPAGLLELETVTKRLLQNYHDQPFSGTIQLDYALESNQEVLGNYGMTLQFTT
jgi:uncharacterized beta-barrel protein YwiB (DUF1934 family)